MGANLALPQEELDKIIKSVKINHGFDFSGYAMTSFSRRIVRFLEKNNFKDADELTAKLSGNKEFFEFFINEVTVNTTDLFRDPGFWFQFRKRLVKKFQKLDRIRIWHAACSSGEEMISMAILLKEEGLLHKTTFLGSDINNDIINTAKSHRYHSWRLKQYEKNYEEFEGKAKLSDYYKMDGNYLQFDKNLLANAEFRNFNLVKDSQYKKFDLILCRNVLIYFTKDQQAKVIDLLSDSIDGKGYLVLGAQESISWHKNTDAFFSISNDFKIFKKMHL